MHRYVNIYIQIDICDIYDIYIYIQIDEVFRLQMRQLRIDTMGMSLGSKDVQKS